MLIERVVALEAAVIALANVSTKGRPFYGNQYKKVGTAPSPPPVQLGEPAPSQQNPTKKPKPVVQIAKLPKRGIVQIARKPTRGIRHD